MKSGIISAYKGQSEMEKHIYTNSLVNTTFGSLLTKLNLGNAEIRTKQGLV